jgi:hypothetical protein
LTAWLCSKQTAAAAEEEECNFSLSPSNRRPVPVRTGTVPVLLLWMPSY